MNLRTALLALFAAVSWPCLSLAQSAAPATPSAPNQSAPGQSATANGVILLAVQPSPTSPQGATPVSSLLWIYDTNTKQLMLCNSHVDASFYCTSAVTLKW